MLVISCVRIMRLAAGAMRLWSTSSARDRAAPDTPISASSSARNSPGCMAGEINAFAEGADKTPPPYTTGSVKRNVAPLPAVDSTQIRPP